MISDGFPNFGTIYYVSEWAIRLAMLIRVPLRRTPEATRSWLLLIFFLPIPGLLLYLAIGRPRFPEWRATRFRALAPLFVTLKTRLSAIRPNAGLSGVSSAVQELAEKLGQFPAVCGNDLEFIDEYDLVMTRLIADIDHATLYVRLLVYIFADDSVGREVIGALERAVVRGVKCHVLLDSVGSHRWSRHTIHLLLESGVEVREALPRRLWHGRTRRDMRNHRKLFLIDGNIGYMGSQNLVAKDFRPGITNHELAVRVVGPVVAEMTAIFLADWYLETETMLPGLDEIPPPKGAANLQVLPSGANYPLEGFETLLVWQVHAARDRVTIVTPYLIPDEALFDAMRTAALRGVKIDLIVSAVVDQILVSLAQRSYYEDLLEAGICIYRFRKNLLHAKNVSVDGEMAIVGSSNVDVRSFQLNEEVSLLLLDSLQVAQLEAIQRGYITQSDKIDLSEWRERPKIQKFAENLARLVSPLL